MLLVDHFKIIHSKQISARILKISVEVFIQNKQLNHNFGNFLIDRCVCRSDGKTINLELKRMNNRFSFQSLLLEYSPSGLGILEILSRIFLHIAKPSESCFDRKKVLNTTFRFYQRNIRILFKG